MYLSNLKTLNAICILLKPNSIRLEVFNHFLCFHVAISILANSQLCLKFNDYANNLLGYFVEGLKYLYGEQYVSYNIHGLLNLASDAHHFGHLDSFSAFPFENFMQIFKRLLRKGDKPLEQIIKRLAELKQLQKVLIHLKQDLICKYIHGEGPILVL
uniref:Uncharacterized protein n=1 Tax=Strigamia maritima TaxID=126957 RepID=T1IHQ3_STRMM